MRPNYVRPWKLSEPKFGPGNNQRQWFRVHYDADGLLKHLVRFGPLVPKEDG